MDLQLSDTSAKFAFPERISATRTKGMDWYVQWTWTSGIIIFFNRVYYLSILSIFPSLPFHCFTWEKLKLCLEFTQLKSYYILLVSVVESSLLELQSRDKGSMCVPLMNFRSAIIFPSYAYFPVLSAVLLVQFHYLLSKWAFWNFASICTSWSLLNFIGCLLFFACVDFDIWFTWWFGYRRPAFSYAILRWIPCGKFTFSALSPDPEL